MSLCPNTSADRRVIAFSLDAPTGTPSALCVLANT
jgi:hypothetical protein